MSPTDRPSLSTANDSSGGRILFVTSVFVPDPASVGQHFSDAAIEAVHRGFRPIVITSRRGYDDPGARYPWTEVWQGIRIVRLPFSSFGKGSMLARMLAGTLFTFQAIWVAMMVPRLKRCIVSTVPPQSPVVALALRFIRRVPFTYWVMDLNPDLAVELGAVSPNHLLVRLLSSLQRLTLRHADRVIALDRFMSTRLERYCRTANVAVLPPWPHDDKVEPIARSNNEFRVAHDLGERLVVMYSGNHGLHNPLGDVLDAARRLVTDPRIMFVFVGGGVGKGQIDKALDSESLPNVLSLPYQPLERLKYSLGAGDIHVVTMEPSVVGISHPCKVYGAMAAGRPVLFLGPRESHVADILAAAEVGWHFDHGDCDGLVALLQRLANEGHEATDLRGKLAGAVAARQFSRRTLLKRFGDLSFGA